MTDHPDAEALRALGWDAAWAAAFAPHAAGGLAPARVVAHHRTGYVVAGPPPDRPAVLAGRLRHLATDPEALPAVGDWVGVAAHSMSDGPASIRAVLPRRGAFRRAAPGGATVAQVVAANVDVALVAAALPDGVRAGRLARYLTLAWEAGAMPVVVLTKRDRADEGTLAARLAESMAAAPGAPVLALSAATGGGLDALAPYLESGRTAVLLGPSGVGKSTLVNRLLGQERQRTAAVRADDDKGRHTTTGRELVRLPGGALLLDTPGMRELQLWDADAGLRAAFEDVAALAAGCRFADCAHDAEPGCAVRAAVSDGTLPAERLAQWQRLARELAHLERRQDARAAAEHRDATRRIHRAVRTELRRRHGKG